MYFMSVNHFIWRALGNKTANCQIFFHFGTCEWSYYTSLWSDWVFLTMKMGLYCQFSLREYIPSSLTIMAFEYVRWSQLWPLSRFLNCWTPSCSNNLLNPNYSTLKIFSYFITPKLNTTTSSPQSTSTIRAEMVYSIHGAVVLPFAWRNNCVLDMLKN